MKFGPTKVVVKDNALHDARTGKVIKDGFASRKDLEDYAAHGKDKAYCLNCHAPQAVVFPDLADTMVKQIITGDPTFEGVGCIQCHLIKGVDPNVKGHAPIKLEPGRTVFGGYKDPLESKAHDTQFLELYKKSDLCLACHTIAPVAVPEAEAVGNWKGSKAAKEGKTCQSCHMPQGFGESANEEKKRDIAGHEFNGKSPALRRQSFDLDYETETQGDQTKLTVKVKNLVPHNIPTTHPIWNQIYLQVVIRGRNLTEAFREKRIYGRTFADSKGNKTVLDHEAVKLLEDTTLKTEETRIEKFTFPTGVPLTSSTEATVASKVTACPNTDGSTDEVLDAEALRTIQMKSAPWLRVMCAKYYEQSADKVQTDI